MHLECLSLQAGSWSGKDTEKGRTREEDWEGAPTAGTGSITQSRGGGNGAGPSPTPRTLPTRDPSAAEPCPTPRATQGWMKVEEASGGGSGVRVGELTKVNPDATGTLPISVHTPWGSLSVTSSADVHMWA